MQSPPLSHRYQRGDRDLRGAIEAEKRVYETPSNWTPWEHEPPQESRGHVHRAAGPHAGTGIGLRAATTSACVQYVLARGRHQATSLWANAAREAVPNFLAGCTKSATFLLVRPA